MFLFHFQKLLDLDKLKAQLEEEEITEEVTEVATEVITEEIEVEEATEETEEIEAVIVKVKNNNSELVSQSYKKFNIGHRSLFFD